MAERRADLAAQIESVRQLEAVVTAMRGIAVSRAQRGRSLLPGIDAYAAVVAAAISQALNLLPADGVAAVAQGAARRGVILFAAEQGFVGAFNERVLDAAAREPTDTTIFLLGTRGAALAAERGLRPAWRAAMATHAEAIPDLANRLAEALYSRVTHEGLARVDVVFPRATAAGGIEVDRLSLMPIDFSRFARPALRRMPLINLAPSRLLEQFAAEYIYAELCRAAMHAFEAENEARMLAMGSARTNIEGKLADLSQRERQLRQQEITAEILELATGAQASS
jgi:F-type H+-transporting ATPase subunit gamma